MDGQKKPSGSSLDIGVFGPRSRQRVPYGTRDKGPQDTDGPNALSLLRVYLRIFVCTRGVLMQIFDLRGPDVFFCVLLELILLLAQVLKSKILGAVGHSSAEGRKVADMLVAFSLHQVLCSLVSQSQLVRPWVRQQQRSSWSPCWELSALGLVLCFTRFPKAFRCISSTVLIFCVFFNDFLLQTIEFSPRVWGELS